MTEPFAEIDAEQKRAANMAGAMDDASYHPATLRLYHFTCDHGHEQIDRNIVPAAVLTSRASGGPGDLAWFTDLTVPQRDALGLTSHILSCDRTVHRYRATDATDLVPWIGVRRFYPWAEELESAPGARPRHWYVADVPIPVVYDPVTSSGVPE